MHEPGAPFLVAHRGASEEAPENTLPAFERALEVGAPVLECDVHLSADGQVVVIHDPRLDRTTDGSGRVAETRWRRLAALDAGYRARWGDRFAGTRLSRLDELLDLARGRAQVMVEIKREAVDRSGNIEREVMAAARRTDTLEAIGVISMSLRAVRRLRAASPDVPTGYVLRRRGGRRSAARGARLGVDFLIGPTRRWIRAPGLAGGARRRGIRLGAYVVNDRASLEAMLERGVESLATDRPREMALLLP